MNNQKQDIASKMVNAGRDFIGNVGNGAKMVGGAIGRGISSLMPNQAKAQAWLPKPFPQDQNGIGTMYFKTPSGITYAVQRTGGDKPILQIDPNMAMNPNLDFKTNGASIQADVMNHYNSKVKNAYSFGNNLEGQYNPSKYFETINNNADYTGSAPGIPGEYTHKYHGKGAQPSQDWMRVNGNLVTQDSPGEVSGWDKANFPESPQQQAEFQKNYSHYGDKLTGTLGDEGTTTPYQDYSTANPNYATDYPALTKRGIAGKMPN